MKDKTTAYFELQREIESAARRLADEYFALTGEKNWYRITQGDQRAHPELVSITDDDGVKFEHYESWAFGGQETHHFYIPLRFLTDQQQMIDLRERVRKEKEAAESKRVAEEQRSAQWRKEHEQKEYERLKAIYERTE